MECLYHIPISIIVVDKPATIYRFKWTYGTGNGIRTRTPLRATDFKSVVSTSFTIPANIKAAIYTCRAASPRFVAYIIEKLTTGTSRGRYHIKRSTFLDFPTFVRPSKLEPDLTTLT